VEVFLFCYSNDGIELSGYLLIMAMSFFKLNNSAGINVSRMHGLAVLLNIVLCCYILYVGA